MLIHGVLNGSASGSLPRKMPDFAAWFARRGRWTRVCLMALLGLIAASGQAPIELWPLTLLALAILFVIYPKASTPRAAFFLLWVFGTGYFAFALRWIVEPFLVDVARHGWMAPFALVLMAGGAGFFWAVAGWAAKRLGGRAIHLALALVAVEFARAHILTGFPWALLGHIWIETPLAQLAAWGGPHLLSVLTVGLALALAALFTRKWVAGLMAINVAVIAGYFLQPPPAEIQDGPIVRLVQPNAPQSQKWDPAYRDIFLNRLLSMTAEGDVPDLVVWPETSVPYLLNHIEDDLTLLSDAARGAPLVFGIQRRGEGFDAYNSLAVMERGGEITGLYDKQHLVPFGEYIPGARLLGRMGLPGLAGNLGRGFTPGAQLPEIDLPGIGLARPLICYEGIFAEEIATSGARPRLLLLITNDAWFGEAAGPQQHIAQARLRAIEQGLPMVRVANTGVTAMIDPYGRITSVLRPGADAYLDATLPAALPPTLYSRFSDWPILGFLMAAFALAFWKRAGLTD